MRYDLSLFRELQDEYRDKPVVPVARGLDGKSLSEAAVSRVKNMVKKVGDISGARVLEVGCGHGHVSRHLADEYGCETVGVDVFDSEFWPERPDLRFHNHDISTLDNEFLGKFDLIVSFAVWEHIKHPFAALSATRDLLTDDGRMYLFANLHRGPKASHRYREVFFPWPHLLFQDDVFVDYYDVDLGISTSGAAWVNRLTAGHYLTYFDRLDYSVDQLWWSPISFDRPFYERFEDELGRYPIYDLERDFIYAVVSPDKPTEVEDEPVVDTTTDLQTQIKRLTGQRDKALAQTARLQRQRDRARTRVQELEQSTSWRVTEPLRRLRSKH